MLGYEIVDQAVTISYGQDSYDEAQRALTILKRLTPAVQGRNQRLAFLELLREQNPKGFIVATDSTGRWTGWSLPSRATAGSRPSSERAAV